MANGGESWLAGRKDDDRECTRGALLESSPGRMIPGRLVPQPMALAIVRLAGAHLDLLPPYLDLGVGEGAQVVDPSRVTRAPAVAADDDKALVVGHVRQPRGPPLAALGPDVTQQQHRRTARDVMADPAPGRLVQRLVSAPQAAPRRPALARLAQALSHVSLPGSFHYHLPGRLAQDHLAGIGRRGRRWPGPAATWAGTAASPGRAVKPA